MYLGHKTSDMRMDLNYTQVSDKTKIEMCFSVYNYFNPNIVLPENLLDEIWIQATRLRVWYRKYSREVKTNILIYHIIL